jgi:hypothetical protein
VKTAGISAAFAASVFKPKMQRAPDSGDVRHAQGSYAQAEVVARQSQTVPSQPDPSGSASAATGRPGATLNLKA